MLRLSRDLVTHRRVVAARTWWLQSLGGRGVTRMRELDLDTHALALCAQQVLCTAPLVVAVSAVLQRETGHNISVGLSRFFGLGPKPRHDLSLLFGRTSHSISTAELLLGLITAVVFMTSVGAVQQRAFEMIWTLPRRTGVRAYLRLLLFAPAVAAFTLGILLVGKIFRSLDVDVALINSWSIVAVQASVTFLFYWWTQYWLLAGRVSYRALLPGAALVTVLVVTMVRVSRLIVPGQISWQVDAYGLIGAVFVLSVWLMVLSALTFGGVLFGALIAERNFDAVRAVEQETPLTQAGLDAVELEGGPADEQADGSPTVPGPPSTVRPVEQTAGR